MNDSNPYPLFSLIHYVTDPGVLQRPPPSKNKCFCTLALFCCYFSLTGETVKTGETQSCFSVISAGLKGPPEPAPSWAPEAQRAPDERKAGGVQEP